MPLADAFVQSKFKSEGVNILAMKAIVYVKVTQSHPKSPYN